jgi:hypothetical protein
MSPSWLILKLLFETIFPFYEITQSNILIKQNLLSSVASSGVFGTHTACYLLLILSMAGCVKVCKFIIVCLKFKETSLAVIASIPEYKTLPFKTKTWAYFSTSSSKWEASDSSLFDAMCLMISLIWWIPWGLNH